MAFESLIPPTLGKYWGNYLAKNMPRFNSRRIYGTYGAIMLRIQWEYPYALPNYLYQTINNAAEASWWLSYYRNRPDIDGVTFFPAPAQYSMGTFTPPVLPSYVEYPGPEVMWEKDVLLAGPYKFGDKGYTY